MTQLESARRGKLTAEMKRVARDEGLSAEFIRKGVSNGRIVIPKNIKHDIARLCGIGEGLRTKINANIGTSKDSSIIAAEIKKMEESIKLGADTIMDLSTGSRISQTRLKMLAKSTVPVGTVPIYEMAINALDKYGSITGLKTDEIFDILESQASDGVDFFTIHAGVTRRVIDIVKRSSRLLDIVSRGGAFLAEWIIGNNRENPFYENFDRVIDLARRYDVTLSLGDGLRPGSVADATDKPQIAELTVLGELQKRAVKKGVQ
ncbi:MAG: phosphomethylpyrimidine synthase ThiC, partial [Candidatus Omnitrophica bacterium]|nr:phosphomethylpyrimidine synthase ThiC [Candidatus Omnitrophota bacterium]